MPSIPPQQSAASLYFGLALRCCGVEQWAELLIVIVPSSLQAMAAEAVSASAAQGCSSHSHVRHQGELEGAAVLQACVVSREVTCAACCELACAPCSMMIFSHDDGRLVCPARCYSTWIMPGYDAATGQCHDVLAVMFATSAACKYCQYLADAACMCCERTWHRVNISWHNWVSFCLVRHHGMCVFCARGHRSDTHRPQRDWQAVARL